MPSLLTHTVIGVSASLPFLRAESLRRHLSGNGLVFSAIIFSGLPDLDGLFLGIIPYGSFFGHRGFFHSPAFLTAFALLCAYFFLHRGREAAARATVLLATLWVTVAASHPLLDALTDGGRGVMLLFPFSDGRYFFPWRPIRVSPIGIDVFWSSAPEVLSRELPFCLGAAFLGVTAFLLLRPRHAS